MRTMERMSSMGTMGTVGSIGIMGANTVRTVKAVPDGERAVRTLANIERELTLPRLYRKEMLLTRRIARWTDTHPIVTNVLLIIGALVTMVATLVR